jgi:adenine-specific DNA methylase
LIKYLPDTEPERTVCLAALISAASKCAAAPGHTAQPFQPTASAKDFLAESWSKDILQVTKDYLKRICPRYARVAGSGQIGDAIEVAKTLSREDLVIIDPPYSAVQYSRFYHVLETIAVGECSSVSGVGRYPPRLERPQSDFSKRSTVQEAFRRMFDRLADAGSTVILTFPDGECSTGISGRDVVLIASDFYTLEERQISGRFSTMGGNGARGSRNARAQSSELLLLMHPRR